MRGFDPADVRAAFAALELAAAGFCLAMRGRAPVTPRRAPLPRAEGREIFARARPGG